MIIVPDMGKNLVIHVGKVLQCEYGADVEALSEAESIKHDAA